VWASESQGSWQSEWPLWCGRRQPTNHLLNQDSKRGRRAKNGYPSETIEPGTQA